MTLTLDDVTRLMEEQDAAPKKRAVRSKKK